MVSPGIDFRAVSQAMSTRNALEARIEADKQGIVGAVGYGRGKLNFGAYGGATWGRDWKVGARATWRF